METSLSCKPAQYNTCANSKMVNTGSLSNGTFARLSTVFCVLIVLRALLLGRGTQALRDHRHLQVIAAKEA